MVWLARRKEWYNPSLGSGGGHGTEVPRDIVSGVRGSHCRHPEGSIRVNTQSPQADHVSLNNTDDRR